MTATPWTVVAFVHSAACPLVGVPVFDTLPPAESVVQDGAVVVPLLCRTCPDDPLASIAVVPAADWYGIVPPEPPARWVAVPAVKPEAVPVRFVAMPDAGVPNAGVTSVGDVANTKAPDPVSSVTADAMFELDGVASAVATPVARPLTPVVIGSPVPLVRTAADGVPNAGVTSVGEVDRTTLPVPVDEVTPVPPFATGSVPVTPVVSGSPVRLVATPDDGVPKTGVTSVGDVERTTLPVPVDDVTPVPPFATGNVPVTPVVRGSPVRLVATPDAGVPRAGVTSVGDVARTTDPDPVVPFERLLAANWPTVKAPPDVACWTTCEVPPVAEKSVVPAGSVSVFVPATGGGLTVNAPDVEPLKAMLCVPAIAPVVSAIVTGEFCTS